MLLMVPLSQLMAGLMVSNPLGLLYAMTIPGDEMLVVFNVAPESSVITASIYDALEVLKLMFPLNELVPSVIVGIVAVPPARLKLPLTSYWYAEVVLSCPARSFSCPMDRLLAVRVPAPFSSRH